ncbi:hypothetical protein [Streptomyces cyaneofuscatus]|uniref:hypothetical protein n=1 Tax=Streptomyces cyaneofuscatus TaxID=66883 RepID=UPI003430A43B
MGERCGTEPTVEELEAEYERARQARIDEYDCSFSSRQLAAKLVDTEDELGADVDGICTGMHADVAEAHCEIERLTEIVNDYEHRINWFTTCAQCARLMDAVYDETIRADRYRLAWLSARARVERAKINRASELRWANGMWSDALHDRHRYRLAWLSARRRVAEEANLGAEAVEHIAADRDRWQRRAEARLLGDD